MHRQQHRLVVRLRFGRLGDARQRERVGVGSLGSVPLHVPLRVVRDWTEGFFEPSGRNVEVALESREHPACQREGGVVHRAAVRLEPRRRVRIVPRHAKGGAVAEDESLAGLVIRRAPSRGVDAGGVAGVRGVRQDERVPVAHHFLARVHAVLGHLEAGAMQRRGGVVDANARHAASAQGDRGVAEAGRVRREERRRCVLVADCGGGLGGLRG